MLFRSGRRRSGKVELLVDGKASEFATVLAKGEGKTRRTYLLRLAGEVLTEELAEIVIEVVFEVALLVTAVVSTGYWESPFVFSLTTAASAIPWKASEGIVRNSMSLSSSPVIAGEVEAPEHLVEVDEIANLVTWLSSDDCSFSTGGMFDISGGRATY